MLLKISDTFLIFFLGIVLFTIGLQSEEIIGFEARFYLFAQEMLRHGVTWFPTTYQIPYPDYPGTSTFLIFLAAKLFGHLNKLIAVLPSALASSVTLVFTYLIGATQNRRWGWAAVFFLLFTLTFITEARTISLDQYVTMITAICFYVALIQFRFANITWIFLFVFSFAIRGPLGIVIPTGVLCIYFLMEKNIKQFILVSCLGLLTIIICSSILLAIAHYIGGNNFLQDVWRMQVGSRLQDPNHPPLLFYFTESLGGYSVVYPLALLVVLASLADLKKSKKELLIKCIMWAVVILIGLSIPADKKMRYLLPLSPALALICASLWNDKHNKYLRVIRVLFSAIIFFLPIVAIGLLIYFYQNIKIMHVHVVLLIFLLSVIQCVMVFSRKKSLSILGLASLTFFLMNVFVIEKINLYANQTKDFVLKIEALREQQHAKLVFFQEGSDGLPIKYLVNMPTENSATYLHQSEELRALRSPAIVIVSAENLTHVPSNFTVLQQGKIGHDRVIVLLL